MANFPTHITVAAIGSALCASAALAGHMAPARYLPILTAAGTIGGILPDIDLDNAVPSRLLFAIIGILVAFGSVAWLGPTYSVLELWCAWLAVYFLVRHGGHRLFIDTTNHRGIWHSLLAAVFVSVLTVDIFARIAGERDALAWLTGLFVFLGFVTHLVLDEIYSVDVEGRAVKRSFGTALKVFDGRAPVSTFLMTIALVIAFFFSPQTRPFVREVRPVSFFGTHFFPPWAVKFIIARR